MTIGHGENPTGNQHDPKGGIHDPSRPPPVRQPAAQGPQQGCRENICGRQQACGGETHIEIIHVVFRQPSGKRHIGAENGHIIKREPPDSDVPQRLQHLRNRLRCARRPVILGHDNEGENAHDNKEHSVDDGDESPPALNTKSIGGASGGGDQRRTNKLSDRSAHIAGAENPQCQALTILPEPGRVPGRPHREKVTGETNQEGER